eukprot:12885612-Prorocentrum_lima.AAC.1
MDKIKTKIASKGLNIMVAKAQGISKEQLQQPARTAYQVAKAAIEHMSEFVHPTDFKTLWPRSYGNPSFQLIQVSTSTPIATGQWDARERVLVVKVIKDLRLAGKK